MSDSICAKYQVVDTNTSLCWPVHRKNNLIFKSVSISDLLFISDGFYIVSKNPYTQTHAQKIHPAKVYELPPPKVSYSIS